MERIMKSTAVAVACLVILAALPACARAEGKALKPSKTVGGRIDADQAKEAPPGGVIVSPKGLEKVWKAWKIKDVMPKVDFAKELVLVALNNCSSLGINPRLDDKGDLTTNVINTDDIRNDYVFQMVVVSREGVKTVHGKALPKE
jgi:hypothetical protein